MADYLTLASKIETDITEGHYAVGSRLPTQRDFAREHGVAVSTANRVYAELTKRGLIVGEVGRGSFVRERSTVSALSEPRGPLVDLEYNFPILPMQSELLVPTIESIIKSKHSVSRCWRSR